MRLKALTLETAQKARQWRNAVREALRTPFLLTEEMQDDFFHALARDSRNRFWDVVRGPIQLGGVGTVIGMAGLVGIEWENSLAEISLILAPEYRGKGYGKHAVELVLHEGFQNMNLANIYGECYECNPSIGFWSYLASKQKAVTAVLPNRKYWDGRYWDSLYFNFERPAL